MLCFCWRINKWTAVSFPERRKRVKCSYTLFRMLLLLCVRGSSEWGTCVPWFYERWKIYIEILVLIWYNASFWWISLKFFLLKCVFRVPFLSEFWHGDYRFPGFWVFLLQIVPLLPLSSHCLHHILHVHLGSPQKTEAKHSFWLSIIPIPRYFHLS